MLRVCTYIHSRAQTEMLSNTFLFRSCKKIRLTFIKLSIYNIVRHHVDTAEIRLSAKFENFRGYIRSLNALRNQRLHSVVNPESMQIYRRKSSISNEAMTIKRIQSTFRDTIHPHLSLSFETRASRALICSTLPSARGTPRFEVIGLYYGPIMPPQPNVKYNIGNSSHSLMPLLFKAWNEKKKTPENYDRPVHFQVIGSKITIRRTRCYLSLYSSLSLPEFFQAKDIDRSREKGRPPIFTILSSSGVCVQRF